MKIIEQVKSILFCLVAIALIVVSISLVVKMNTPKSSLGGSFTSEPTYLTSSDEWQAVNSLFEYGDLEVVGTSYLRGTVNAYGAVNVSGALTGSTGAFSSYINYLLSTERVSSVGAAVVNTSTVAESGKTYFITTSTSQFLPAVASATGTFYRFVVAANLTASSTIKTYDGGDVIEGTLIVAGAVVDCDAEDTITIGINENLGDFVELYSDGQKWFIGASGALTALELACSAT